MENSSGEDVSGRTGELLKFDTSVAHIARVQDYWLGGKDHFRADREAGDEAVSRRRHRADRG